MTFKPLELYEPLKYETSFDQQKVYKTPVNIATDTLYLEGVDYVYFKFDAAIEGEDTVIDWCEICITFAAGGEMFIKTTDRNTLKAFGFDFESAADDANSLLEDEGSIKSEHCILWGLK